MQHTRSLEAGILQSINMTHRKPCPGPSKAATARCSVHARRSCLRPQAPPQVDVRRQDGLGLRRTDSARSARAIQLSDVEVEDPLELALYEHNGGIMKKVGADFALSFFLDGVNERPVFWVTKLGELNKLASSELCSLTCTWWRAC